MKEIIKFLDEEAKSVQKQIIAEKKKSIQYIQNYQPGQPPCSDHLLVRLSMHLDSIDLLMQRTKQMEMEKAKEKKVEKPKKPLKTINPKKVSVSK